MINTLNLKGILTIESNLKANFGVSVSSQSKTVSPSNESQTVTPDTNYDYLKSVTVNAISYEETPNDYGTTVTIAGDINGN